MNDVVIQDGSKIGLKDLVLYLKKIKILGFPHRESNFKRQC